MRKLLSKCLAGMFAAGLNVSCDSFNCAFDLAPSQYGEHAFSSWHEIKNPRFSTGEPNNEYARIPSPEREWERILLLYENSLSGSVRPVLRSDGTEVEIRLGYESQVGFDAFTTETVSVRMFYLEGDFRDSICLSDALREMQSLGVSGNSTLEVRNYGPGNLMIDSVGN